MREQTHDEIMSCQALHKAHHSGLTWQEIAEKLGVSRRSVNNWIKGLAISAPNRGKIRTVFPPSKGPIARRVATLTAALKASQEKAEGLERENKRLGRINSLYGKTRCRHPKQRQEIRDDGKTAHCRVCGGTWDIVSLSRAEQADAKVAELEKERDAYRTNYEDTIRQLKRVWTGCDTVGLAHIATEVVNKAVEDKAKVARLVEGIRDIRVRCAAYPESLFPEPDFAKAHKLLKTGGMTLDAISASNMRRVTKDLGEIAKQLLADSEEGKG